MVSMQAALLVVAGGSSRRMGRPKAWLEVGHTILLRWVTDRLAPEFDEVLVSFADPEQLEQPVPYRVVFDRKVSAGPMAGIEAGLAASRHDAVFVIACDMPFVTPDIASLTITAVRTADAAVPRIDGRPEPVCAAYRKSALPIIAAALDAGQRRASDVLSGMDVTWLEDIDRDALRSINTPDDFVRFQAEVGPGHN
jgi:molybdopterin-guanine dinucleotide biosynthesis protein A